MEAKFQVIFLGTQLVVLGFEEGKVRGEKRIIRDEKEGE